MFDDDDEPHGPDGDDSGRAPTDGQGGDEMMVSASAGVTEEPDADAADALFAVAVPDR